MGTHTHITVCSIIIYFLEEENNPEQKRKQVTPEDASGRTQITS